MGIISIKTICHRIKLKYFATCFSVRPNYIRQQIN